MTADELALYKSRRAALVALIQQQDYDATLGKMWTVDDFVDAVAEIFNTTPKPVAEIHDHDPYNCSRGYWTAKCLIDCAEQRAAPPATAEREALIDGMLELDTMLTEGGMRREQCAIILDYLESHGFRRQGPSFAEVEAVLNEWLLHEKGASTFDRGLHLLGHLARGGSLAQYGTPAERAR